MRQAVILSFDSLAANSLGCYGNEWIETPHWDRLATTGIVFDRHFADTLGPMAGMAWADGRHALLPSQSTVSNPLGGLLSSGGVATKLIACGEIQNWHRCGQFGEIQTVEACDDRDARPDDVQIARLIKAGLSAWNDESFQANSRLLWLHSPGPGVPPEGFDSLYFEDFEERGQRISELSDEARARHPAVYGGSVSLLDYWLGELLAGIDARTTDEPTLVIVMAAKGHLWHAMARHTQNRIQSLCDQRIRTPLVLKINHDDRYRESGCRRSNRLVQTCDLVPTLLDWFGLAPVGGDQLALGQSWLQEITEQVSSRSSLWIGDEVSFDALRTADWLCVRDNTVELAPDSTVSNRANHISLFVKPEDIWDVNDIASQQPEIISELLNQFPKY